MYVSIHDMRTVEVEGGIWRSGGDAGGMRYFVVMAEGYVCKTLMMQKVAQVLMSSENPYRSSG